MTQGQFSKLTQTDGVNFQRGQMLLLLLRKTFITTIVFELNDKKYILCWRDIQLWYFYIIDKVIIMIMIYFMYTLFKEEAYLTCIVNLT